MKSSFLPRLVSGLGLRRFVSAAVACALLSACTTTRRFPVTSPVQITAAVSPRDYVILTRRDGSHTEFKVTAVNATELRGETQTVPVSEIAQIEVKGFSGFKTSLLVVGTLLVVVGLAAGAAGPGFPDEIPPY